MQQHFARPAGNGTAWLDEAPAWAELTPIGHVDSYWKWRGDIPASSAARTAAWGYRAGFGGKGEYGVLGGRFEPHGYPYLQVSVAATSGLGPESEGPWRRSNVGLPLEYIGGVLTGALQEPERLGPGRLTITHGATHPVDSSWNTFRLVAIGLVRLLAAPEGQPIPADLLPRFGAQALDAPGSD